MGHRGVAELVFISAPKIGVMAKEDQLGGLEPMGMTFNVFRYWIVNSMPHPLANDVVHPC